MTKKGQYINLKPSVTSWAIYAISGPYTREHRLGELGPAQFGGLSYQIEEEKGNHIYVIQTESFGRVAIWAGDSDSTFTQSPVYTNNSSAGAGGTGRYVNLSPSVPTWSIYNVEGPYTRANRIGALAPTQFGGLSYQIEEDLGNHIYVIRTDSFGRVAIWAGDQDSTFTHSPTYTNSSTSTPGGTGRYLNLSPNVPVWSVYNPNGPYTRPERIGAVGPAQFGGLSYEIQGVKGNDIYLIQTESFGLVAIWAGDSDSTFTSTPLYLDSINGGKGGGSTSGTGEYLNLNPRVPEWSVYNVDGPYTRANRIGALAPSRFGGLSYAILGKPLTDIYLIETESFGKVAIWAGDNDSSVTGSPRYEAGSYTGGSSSGGTFMNLSPTVSTWSVYNVNGPYTRANRIGALAPARFGGLSYRILEAKGNDIYVIQTESFGKVAIWAGDSDSTFTNYSVYSNHSAAPPSDGSTGGLDLSKVPFTIQSRSKWRASSPQPSGMSGKLKKIKYLVIHHTAGAQPQIGSDQAVMRGIQNYHQGLDWGDIGYHFCIGQEGTVMEGRSTLDVGAHVGQPHNYDSLGVSLFGNFMYTNPKPIQTKKLISLLVFLCQEYNVSPDNILGHRDMTSNYGGTSCPGDHFYRTTNNLQVIRGAVKKELLKEAMGLTLNKKKQIILDKIKNTFKGIPFFGNIPFDMTMWETEYSQPISSNITMKTKLSLETSSSSPISDYININLTKYPLTLEGPLFDFVKEQKIDDVEFYNAQEAMERLGEELGTQGNVRISLGADGEKILLHYIVDFNATKFSDGSSLRSSCRLTFEIDNKTFVTPDAERVPVSNNEMNHLFRSLPAIEVSPALIMTMIFVIGFLVNASSLGAATIIGIVLLLDENQEN